ncbi:phage virion morphogenesis protein [Vibrio sp. HN007]|uniref:phage virion morphogenesis protein n=1 Tax=Vibrio iocasae TaxID=3098914 RepID=UPI0035D40EC4
MIEFDANDKSFLRAKEQLELLGLPKKSRQRILKELGKYYTKQTRKNIRAQRGPDGAPWKKRQKGRRKMMRGFTKKLKHFHKNKNWDLFVGWPSARGTVAFAHHHGKEEQSGLTKRKRQAKKKKEPSKSEPATREQAKELRDLDYRLPKQGRQKRGKKPTIKFIMQNMTVGEAAKKIQELENRTPARSWDINRPERRLIGASPKRVAMIIKREMKRIRSN